MTGIRILRALLRVPLMLGLACLPLTAPAHHSATEYDATRVVEFSGTLSEVSWQNPHVLLKVVAVAAGATTTWEIECNPIAILERSGVHRQSLKLGDRVKVAGIASRISSRRVFGTQLLAPGAGELLLAPEARPRWQVAAANRPAILPGVATQVPPNNGLFKVWSSVMTDPDANPIALWSTDVSLTPVARAALQAWDILRDTIAPGCRPQGMPSIMANPLPMQFEDHGATIVLRLEEYETVRTIHMQVRGTVPKGKSLLGKSARIQEVFTPSLDGKRPRYLLTIDDHDTFTVTPVLGRSWVWQANDRVHRYACGRIQDTSN